MHAIAHRAIHGNEPIVKLVEDFYGAGGPLAEAGWEIRPAQREMSLRFAAQIDGVGDGQVTDMDDEEAEEAAPAVYEGSVGLIEAPCGVGKGQAYLVPGFLAALRAESRFSGRVGVSSHPAKLVVSTANIALQSQLVRKDIPALGRMLGVNPRATLMKSRQNYVCWDKVLTEGSSMFAAQNAALDDVIRWSRQPGCDGDRESYPGDASEVWSRVSVSSEECGRQACPHYDVERGGAAPCFWRQATVAWPSSHIIVGNHHWVALSKGIRVLAYAVDEAHELEAALRGVQGRTLSSATFLTTARRAAKALGLDRMETERLERMCATWATTLLEAVERVLDRALDCPESSDPKYRAPVPLPDRWLPDSLSREVEAGFRALRDLRDRVLDAALALPYNRFQEGEVRTDSRGKGEDAKKSRQAAVAANKLAELCRMYGACVAARSHPDWPSPNSPWAIWAHREQDGRDQWRVVVEFVPADVAPAFSALYAKMRTVMLASATLPDFTSMRLSLGLGARATGRPREPWPSAYATDTGRWASRVVLHTKSAPEPVPDDTEPSEFDDEPVSRTLDIPSSLAPEPVFERRLPSPYPLADMGVLVVPEGPPPKEAIWSSWAVQRVVQAVRAADGGALVLATSNAAMVRYANALREVGRWNVLRQGEQGRTRTIAAFKDDEDSVLVGTRSFFQGLDVQGRSCRLVVIDRIPFASPEDPLENAVGRLLVERAQDLDPAAQGVSAWMLRSVPEASMVLVQGVGRLIRSQQDRGAVVLLDNRILYNGQGWSILREALPPFPLSRDLGDVARVLRGEAPASPMYRARRATRELVC